MKRTTILLLALGAVAMTAAWYLLLFQPRNGEIDELRAETAQLEAQARDLETQLVGLRQVREQAPEYEARLVAANSVIPHEPAMPSLLRQLQVAADEAGVALKTVAPARPTPVTVEGAETGLANINVVVDVEGGYFNLVDFLRRIEDPSISARGLLWASMNVTSERDDYPLLKASLQGDVFAMMPVAPAEAEATPPPAEGEAPAEGADTTDTTGDAPAADSTTGEGQ